jgi:hypothetical protein
MPAICCRGYGHLEVTPRLYPVRSPVANGENPPATTSHFRGGLYLICHGDSTIREDDPRDWCPARQVWVRRPGVNQGTKVVVFVTCGDPPPQWVVRANARRMALGWTSSRRAAARSDIPLASSARAATGSTRCFAGRPTCRELAATALCHRDAEKGLRLERQSSATLETRHLVSNFISHRPLYVRRQPHIVVPGSGGHSICLAGPCRFEKRPCLDRQDVGYRASIETIAGEQRLRRCNIPREQLV